jgi:DNA-binding transcriptional ArsR family regulator
MTPDRLTLTFAALADPTRRQIVDRLARGEATVTELADPLPISMPAVSRHLKVLQHAGLVARGRDAQWRPSRLQPEPLAEAIDWIGTRQVEWERRMDRLDKHLHTKGTHNDHRRQI